MQVEQHGSDIEKKKHLISKSIVFSVSHFLALTIESTERQNAISELHWSVQYYVHA